MTRQPHLDHRAIHPFYGSQMHYIALLLVMFLLLCTAATLAREVYNLAESRHAEAQVLYKMSHSAFTHDGDQATTLVFYDAELGAVEYFVHDEAFKKRLIAIDDYWKALPIRYQVDETGDVYALEIYTLSSSLTWLLVYVFSTCILIFLLYRLSPKAYWYWKNAKRHFKRLSRNWICLDVRVDRLNELGITYRHANRLCSLTGSVYIHTQNTYIKIHSPHFLVEPQFRMSHPIMKVYINPHNLKQYEVDFLDFLEQNQSTFHGYAGLEQDLDTNPRSFAS